MGPSITSPEPAAAVSNAGGLGIISVALRPHLGPEGLTFPQDAHVVLARTWLSIPSVWRAVGR
jgi:NAD(P)H-dependent flavin oxidoreductase YrpB (nitropropane dioxygenase family)